MSILLAVIVLLASLVLALAAGLVPGGWAFIAAGLAYNTDNRRVAIMPGTPILES